MRIIINRLSEFGQKTGIGHYTAQLTQALDALNPPCRIDSFPQGLIRRTQSLGTLVRRLLEARPRRPATPTGTPSAGAGGPTKRSLRGLLLSSLRSLREKVLVRHLRALSRRHAYDLYHEPNCVPLPVDLPTVLTLHDLSVLLHPEWHPADRVAYYERGFRRGLEQCVHILTVSDFARQEIIQTLGVPPAQVTRTYNGVRTDLHPLPADEVRAGLRRLGLPPSYLLYVGTLEPRKNILRLLRVYCSLPAGLRERCPLVLVGGWGWNTAALADYLESEARHRGVVRLGYLANEHLITVYNGARALVFPSYYEGFGFPPLEMMACGGPVLASTAGALVETTGGHAPLIDPEDEDGWRDALARIIEDDDWRQSLRRGVVEWARSFTWQGCAADTFRVYQQVTGDKPAVLLRKAG